MGTGVKVIIFFQLRVSYIIDLIELMTDQTGESDEPFYPCDDILQEFASGLALVRDHPNLEIRLMEARKKFKLENDLSVLDDVEQMSKMEDEAPNDTSEDESDDDLDQQIQRVELPKPTKKCPSGKVRIRPFWRF